MNDSSFLTTIFKPENFSSDELELIIAQFEKVSFSKNDYFIRRGNTASYYFFLASGYARSYAVDLDGNAISTNFYRHTDIVIDWNAYFLKCPAKESIQALTDCEAWKITFSDFMKLFSIEAFREVGRTRLVNSYFELKNHSVSMISDTAKDRYLQLMKMKPDIVQNVALKHIATYLGITDTSLSRIRKDILKAL